MSIFFLLVIGLGLYFYSLKCLDAPISAGIRASLLALRLVFLILLLFLLTRPQIQEKLNVTQFPALFIGIDDTESMAYRIDPMEQSQKQTRLEQSIGEIQNNLSPFWRKKGFTTRYLFFSDASKHSPEEATWISHLPQSVTAAFGYTDIANVITSFDHHRNQDEPAYLLLFTDGNWNHGENPQSLAAAPQTPSGNSVYADRRIYSFGIGTTRPMFDLSIDQVQLPSSARENEKIQLTAKIKAHGKLPAAPIPIQVQGQSKDGKSIFSESANLSFDANTQTQTISFPLPTLPIGDYLFTTNIPVQDGELFSKNNKVNKGLRIRKNQDQILMLTSSPGWDFKFLKRVFEEQAYLHVGAYLNQDQKLFQLGDRSWVEKQTSNKSTESIKKPVQTLADLEISLNQISMVVLYNFAFTEEQVDFTQKLRSFVENGGAILFIPGERNKTIPENLKDILPAPLSFPYSIRTQTVLIDPTSLTNSKLLQNLDENQIKLLPPLTPLVLPTAKSAGGTVLLTGRTSTGESIDLIKQYRFGLGRIVSLANHSFWRWEMKTNQDILAPFWLAVLYQCRPQLQRDEGQLTTDGFLYEMYQPIQITYTAKANIGNATISGIPVVVTSPSRKETLWLNPSELGPHRFETNYIPVEPGDYQIANPNADVTTTVHVEVNAQEINNLQQNVTSLQAIAEAAGGEYANFQAWNQLRDKIPNLSKTIVEEKTRFLGEKWWIALILVFFLGMEWFLRWRKGLP